MDLLGSFAMGLLIIVYPNLVFVPDPLERYLLSLLAASFSRPQLLCSVIEQYLGIRFSPSHVSRLIHDYGLAHRIIYPSDRTSLRKGSRKSPGDAEARRRRVAAAMLLGGKSVEYVSEALNVGVRTVDQYLSIVRAGGPNALDSLNARGHESTLDSRQLERLRSALERGPRAHGYTSELWKNGDVQALIKEKLGV
jgi:transposase